MISRSASVLKSPLFGLSEEQLFELAVGAQGLAARSQHTLRPMPALRQADARSSEFARARAARHAVCVLRPCCSGPNTGGAEFSRRLGPEANDALDEFLNLALDYETRETPSLQGFLAWLRAAQSEVKRDMEMVRDEVRVMTVHGAKGLEAPVVILADTTTPPRGTHPPRLLMVPRPKAKPARRRALSGPAAARTMWRLSRRHAPRCLKSMSTSTAACFMWR